MVDPACHIEKAPNDVLYAIGLRENRLRVTRGAFVAADLGEKLLRTTDDHPEGGRDLVSNAHRECAHRRYALRMGELVVALALRFADGELSLEVELFALAPQCRTAEDKHETRRHENAENESPDGSLFAISLAGC